MMEKWKEYVSRQRPCFERAVSDCCTFAADWVETVSGIKPGGYIPRERMSDREALRFLQQRGGVAGLFQEVLEGIGWRKEETPSDFDVVVIQHEEGFLNQIVGVWVSGRLITRGEQGHLVFISNPKVEGVWRWV